MERTAGAARKRKTKSKEGKEGKEGEQEVMIRTLEDKDIILYDSGDGNYLLILPYGSYRVSPTLLIGIVEMFLRALRPDGEPDGKEEVLAG